MKAFLVKSTMVLDDGGSLKTGRGIVMASRLSSFRGKERSAARNCSHFYPALTHWAHFIASIGLTSLRRLAAQFGAIPTIETQCDFVTQVRSID